MIKTILAIVLAIVIAFVIGQIFFWLLSSIFALAVFAVKAIIVLIIATPIFLYVRGKLMR
jgi:hypothetical protein